MHRFNSSMKYLLLPECDPKEHLECIRRLVDLDRAWMPDRPNHSLYIRPAGMSWENTLGVKAPSSARIFTILSPVGPYYPRGFNPVKLYCDADAVRAWPNGHGAYKIGGNYGPTIRH